MTTALRESTLPLPLLRRGKVREMYEVDADTLLMVASDRVSAFDVVMDEAVPYKGAVLTQMSSFWLKKLDVGEIIKRVPALAAHRAVISGRAMLVKRTTPVSFECVVRGYLSGSAWAEYQKSGTLAGEPLASGLIESDRLDPPIFSPATKAETGHDENIDMKRCADILGEDMAERVKALSLDIYSRGRAHADECGIIVADTKFEFGTVGGDLLLIDECLTPDSSRFWPKDQYVVGQSPPSFDKQFVRDYLETLDWDKTPPAPRLPKEVIEKSSAKYVEAFRRLTGSEIADA
jgi:phosphoribosylaminoimidazole-succinocarboxamide synthase